MPRNRRTIMAEPTTTTPPVIVPVTVKPPEAPTPKAPPKLTLNTALKSASTGLQLALRALIANKTHDTDPGRLAIETAFENAKNELAGKDANLPTLQAAAKHLEIAAAMLANQSNTPADILREIRSASSLAAKHVEQLTPVAA